HQPRCRRNGSACRAGGSENSVEWSRGQAKWPIEGDQPKTEYPAVIQRSAQAEVPDALVVVALVSEDDWCGRCHSISPAGVSSISHVRHRAGNAELVVRPPASCIRGAPASDGTSYSWQ